MVKKILWFLLPALIGLKGFSQDTSNTIGKVNIASPNAASLGKYGDIPVSYNTGIPQISIPIYTVKSGGLSLPITLSYHAGGIKVQEQASWVGAGWTLNAGGAITRSVMGAPDDRGLSTNIVTNGHYSDYGFNSYLTVSGGGGNPDDDAFARGTKDGEPDLYFFNFGGYTGKFYFNDDRTPIFVPEQDFKIQTYFTLGLGFTGFMVTTPDGVKYYFGKAGNNGSIDPIESTNPSTLQNGPSYTTAAPSAWFLNKIMSADGMDSITLNYQSESYSYYTLSTSPMLYTNYYPNLGDKMGINLVKNFVSGVRLTQINFPNGTINFTKAASARTDLSAGISAGTGMTDATNTSAYALGSVSITNNNGFCKKDSFYYGYFYDNSSLNSTFFGVYSSYNIHSDENLLRLDSLQEATCDGTVTIPSHKFSYFTETVPRRLSFGQDHWGYSNGVNNNPGLVPGYTVITSGVPTTQSGANRDGAWPAMRGGSLQQINYPTGGNSSFDFEPKSIDTFYTSTLQNVTLTSFVVHEYGQSSLTETQSFTAPSTDNYTVHITNNSTNWSPTFTITNSNGTVVYNSGYISTSSTINVTVSLTSGNYTETLAFPSNSSYNLINGADGNISEYQYVPTTTTQTVGGLRIKTITSNDGITPNNIVTLYTYPSGSGSTGGILYNVPVYLQVIRNDLLALVWPLSCSPNGCSSCDGYNAHDYYISAGSIRPMATMQGENVGYPEVDVTQVGNGHSVYRYYTSNIWNNNPSADVCVRTLTQSSLCSTSIINFPSPPLPFEFMRGELKYEGHFNQSGQLLKESYHFPMYSMDPLTTPGHICVNVPGLYSYTEYQLQSAYKIKDSSFTTTYDPTNSTSLTSTSSTFYGSPYHHSPTRTVTTTSKGDSLSTNAKYAFDFRISSCDNVPDSLSYYQNTVHSDSTWLSSTLYSCTPQTNNSSNCRWSTFTQFRLYMAQARVNFINYRRRSYSDPGNTLSTCYATAMQSADAQLLPILRLQNEFLDAPIEETEWRNTNLLHASFTRYDTSLNPLGFTYPAKTQLINLSQPSGSFTNASVSSNSILKDSRYADESTYSFNAGNPVQVIPHSGVTNSYLWDYLNSEPVAKVSGATSDQIAFTSFEADGSGNWAGLNNSFIQSTGGITGNKYYNQTSFSISKSGLNSNNYYIVSYWSKNGSYAVSGTQSGYPKNLNSLTVNGSAWTLYEHLATGQSIITVSGSGAIDELRLFPKGAMMTTYTYIPVLGMSSQSDANNRISFYQYDALGRLNLIRDQDNNILKKIEYTYQGPTGIIAYQNIQKSGSFTRNNCGTGYTGSTVTYTVPAGSYSSPTSQAAADALAQNDVNNNGQAYANTYGTCTSAVTITSWNYVSTSGFTVVFTNTSTSQQYSFSIPSTSGQQTLGNIPPGTYNISISKSGNTVTYYFSVGNTFTYYGTSASFSNVSVNSTSNNIVYIDSGL